MPRVQTVAQLQAIGTMFPLTQLLLWDITPQSPSIPTMLCTFPTTIWDFRWPTGISSTPRVQALAQPQAIGTMFPLTQLVLLELPLLSPSIPTMLSTFPTGMVPTRISSLPPVQAVVQPQAIGTMSPLTQQVMWGVTVQSPSIPMMLCTFPILIIPTMISSISFSILLRISMAIRSVRPCLQD